MNKTFLITSLILVFSIFFLFGCTESNLNICGDGICTVGEENTCVTDCTSPVNATVNINVSGAWDATGDLSLYWYHSKDVYANASANITSRLGDNWFGEQAKNLNISFNDSESGSKPVGDKRNIQMNFTQPGDYYFELRSEDYAYRAVSEKITVSESKDYYVDLQIVPSNPALRVKAVNNNYDIINGPGKIDLYMKRTYYQYGENKEEEFLYDSINFEKGQEVNALFFVYVQKNKLENEYIEYKAVVNVDGYEPQEYYYAPYSKYQEIYARFNKDVEEKTGDLKVSIVPGIGTTQDDLLELEGQEINVYAQDGEIVGKVSNGTAYLEDIPYANYLLRSSFNDFNYQSGIAPVSIEETWVEINQETNNVEVKGLLGIGKTISMVDSQGELIPAEEILQTGYCVISSGEKECMSYETPMKMYMNPMLMSQRAFNEQSIKDWANVTYSVDLEYSGVQNTFDLKYSQGTSVEVWQFDTSVDSNMSVAENSARVVWKSAEPFAITDWRMGGDMLFLDLKNNSSETLTVTSVSAGGMVSSATHEMMPGSTTDLTTSRYFYLDEDCVVGQTYTFDKSSVKIVYASANIEDKIQYGAADIVVPCSVMLTSDTNFISGDLLVGESTFVMGAGEYSMESLKIELIDVLKNGASSNDEYVGKFGLYYQGKLIKIIQASGTFDLRDHFSDSLMATSLIVTNIGLRASDNKYFATIQIG